MARFLARFLARMARSHGSHGLHGSLARTLVKLPLNSMVEFESWEHFNEEYLTEFGGIMRIECSSLAFYYDC